VNINHLPPTQLLLLYTVQEKNRSALAKWGFYAANVSPAINIKAAKETQSINPKQWPVLILLYLPLDELTKGVLLSDANTSKTRRLLSITKRRHATALKNHRIRWAKLGTQTMRVDQVEKIAAGNPRKCFRQVRFGRQLSRQQFCQFFDSTVFIHFAPSAV